MEVGYKSCDLAEEVARELLRSGSVKGGMPLECHNHRAMLQFSDIQQGVLERIVRESTAWAERKKPLGPGLNAIRGQGTWTTISMSGGRGKRDSSTILTIM